MDKNEVCSLDLDRNDIFWEVYNFKWLLETL